MECYILYILCSLEFSIHIYINIYIYMHENSLNSERKTSCDCKNLRIICMFDCSMKYNRNIKEHNAKII